MLWRVNHWRPGSNPCALYEGDAAAVVAKRNVIAALLTASGPTNRPLGQVNVAPVGHQWRKGLRDHRVRRIWKLTSLQPAILRGGAVIGSCGRHSENILRVL